jgi:hypothetical protein
MKANKGILGAAVGLLLLVSVPARAAEEGKSVYLLGAAASMAGMTPPPGFYFSSLSYYYDGKATGSAALSRTLGEAGGRLPGFGVLAPTGYQNIDVTVNARSTLTLPDGTTLQAGRSLKLSDDTLAFGDPLALAFIGWSSGFFHWKLTGMVNIPVGSYAKADLVNMGFNRWAADVTGAMTYLNTTSGLEVSLAPGITFNGENPDTRYRTGTEFHVEGAVMQHVSKSFAFGVTGYHYRQITGDGGAGAVLGSFKGRVSAIGPNLTYNFQVGKVPVLTSFRFLHEFDAKNRLPGNAAIFTLTVPLGGSAAKPHGPS